MCDARPIRTQTYIRTYVSEWVGACVRAWARVFTSRIYPRLWVVTGRSRNVNTAAVTDRTAGPPIRLDRLQTFPTTRGNRTPTIALPACLHCFLRCFRSSNVDEKRCWCMVYSWTCLPDRLFVCRFRLKKFEGVEIVWLERLFRLFKSFSWWIVRETRRRISLFLYFKETETN